MKLLNLIKERMSKNDTSDDQKEEKSIDNKNNEEAVKTEEKQENQTNENNNNIKENNNEKKVEKNASFNNEKIKNKVNDDIKNKEEDRRKKLLKLFDKKNSKSLSEEERSGKKEENKKEENKKEENKKEENKKEENKKDIIEEKKEDKKEEKPNEDNLNKNINNKIVYSNSGSVSYPTFMKKGLGNFSINTVKPKKNSSKKKEDEKDKEIDNKEKSYNKKDDKYTEIPHDQRDKLTINLNQKKIPSTIDDYEKNNSSQKKIEDNKNNNYCINNESMNNNEIIYLSNKNKDENNEKGDNNIENKEFIYETYKKQNTNSKSNSNSNTNNKSNKNSSSKKGAFEILELLKAKKKEQNESINRAKSQDKPINKNKNDEKKIEEKILYNKRNNNMNNTSDNFNHKKAEGSKTKNNRSNGEGKYDLSSLPKKVFRDEEDEDQNDFKFNDSYNRTHQQFRNNKKNNYNKLDNNNNIINRKRNIINNINNINNNINNFFNLNNPQNFQERKTLNYINNANNLRNKYNKKIKKFNSINENERNSPKSYLGPKNPVIQNNVKSLDNSFDLSNSRKNPMGKRVNNNNNYNSINLNSKNNVYEPKKISTNNSQSRFDPFGRNALNNLNSLKNCRKGRIYTKMNSKRNTAYIKKSPLRMMESNNNNYLHNNNTNNNNSNNEANIRNIYYMNNNNDLNKKNVNNNQNYINTNINNNLGTLEVSSIYGLNSSTDTYSTNRVDYINTNYNNYFTKNNNIKNKQENSMLFNLEDLMVLEEKLNDITYALETNKNIERQCFNFWNYYYNCSLYQILEKIFPNEEDSNIVRLSIKYELISIIICYEFSFQMDIGDEDICLSLLELIYLNHNNLMIICEYILTKISQENRGNIWVLKLQYIVNNSKISQIKEIQNNYSLNPVNLISNYTNNIIQKIKIILRNYNSEFSNILNKFLFQLELKSYEEINDFFRLNILRENNFEGSIMASSYLKKNKHYKPIPAPYIREPPSKQFTLILDLDETIINFKIKSTKEGVLRARPFLFGFLEEMSHYYELIVWTSATEAYANSLIDAIEFEKQYFDYVFYREHAIIIGGDFVKDLTRVGRSLDRTIIVDDMPQNFRLQKQNGITIKPFLGDDFNDTALYDLLPILKHIAEEKNDVRIGLHKYRDEIVKKVTSNISKNNI